MKYKFSFIGEVRFWEGANEFIFNWSGKPKHNSSDKIVWYSQNSWYCNYDCSVSMREKLGYNFISSMSIIILMRNYHDHSDSV